VNSGRKKDKGGMLSVVN